LHYSELEVSQAQFGPPAYVAQVSGGGATIARDTSAKGNGDGTSSCNFNIVTGTIDFLFFYGAVFSSGGAPTITNVTAGGTALTQLDTVALDATHYGATWYLKNAGAKSNQTVAIATTLSSSASNVDCFVESLSGTHLTSPIGGHVLTTATGSTSASATVTVGSSGSWLVGGAGNSTAAVSAGSGTLILQSNGGQSSADSNGTVGTGSQSLNFTSTGTTWNALAAVEIAHAP
jgi:hypothetical protein